MVMMICKGNQDGAGFNTSLISSEETMDIDPKTLERTPQGSDASKHAPLDSSFHMHVDSTQVAGISSAPNDFPSNVLPVRRHSGIMIQKSLRIGTLNAQSIFKGSSKTTQKEFTSFLRSKSLQLDILCLQEVSHYRQQDHLTDDNLCTFSFTFPRSSFVVSKQCAIICLKQGLELTDAAISSDERSVTATVQDAHHNVYCKVANVYIPAQAASHHAFLPVLMSMPFWSDLLDAPWILLGDFNTHLHDPVEARGPRIKPFVEWLNTHFLNCFPKGTRTLPRAGSTIDYIFAPSRLATRVLNAQTHHIPPAWTDHSLLTIDLVTSGVRTGPGSWRFDPYLLENREFQALLDKTVELFLASEYYEEDVGVTGVSGAESQGLGVRSVQEKWESLKSIVKYCAQQFTKGQKARFKARVSHLQREREQLLGTAEESARIKKLKQLIEQRIQEDTRQAMLRSATRWLEQGEQNTKYFFNVIKDREAQQTIQSLKMASTGEKLTSMGDILHEARSFYQVLYTPEDIDLVAVNSLFANIPEDAKLQEAEADRLIEPLSTDSVFRLLDHAPKKKSPGLDGLPFEVYSYLAAKFPPVLLLLQQVLTDALNGVFPESWKQTRMVLLFKKGDPELLKNWRPLSLINSDAKLFTKLLANCFKRVLSKLVTPYQTGFMPRRLISNNA